jgi:hypothetical protein
MRDDLPQGTVTFLFTDIEGSTRLLHSLGAEVYANALAEHRRVIREACGAEGGVEVDTQGDAFFFAFQTAPGALTAAAALTESLAPGPIHVRVGLHTGRPLVTDEGYVGDDVHFAARVGASAHGGQVLLSDATRALVDGVALTDLDARRNPVVRVQIPTYGACGDCACIPTRRSITAVGESRVRWKRSCRASVARFSSRSVRTRSATGPGTLIPTERRIRPRGSFVVRGGHCRQCFQGTFANAGPSKPWRRRKRAEV